MLARVTTSAQAKTALERGAAGVLTSIDDVLATTGQLVNVLEAAVRCGSDDGALTEIHEAVAEAFTPLLATLDGVDIDVIAIDVRSDETAELVPQALLDDAPQLLLPISDPDVLRAEMGGLALAAERSGYGSTPRLVVRHVSDPIDPRTDIDSATYELLESVAEVREGRPGCRIGMRLRGRVSDAVAARLHGLGFRLFAVDPDELRVARLALGKAAWK